MRLLIDILLRYRNFIIFLMLEGLCLVLIISYSRYQRVAFLSSASWVSTLVLDFQASTTSYFNLREINNQLMEENARLQAKISNEKAVIAAFEDSTLSKQYDLLPASVVKNSIFLTQNFITIDKGKKHGLHKNMGVITSQGVVGKIETCAENYAIVRSLLNVNYSVSAMISRNRELATVRWDGKSSQYAPVLEVQNHIDVRKGDSVVTSSYNAVFPPEILIGTVESVERSKNQTFSKIRLKLSTDYSRLHFVYVIQNNKYEERKALEEQVEKIAE
ncbi:MAG: rod shape-determining protein MreC [Bernardetiaceae bacterium]|nr:rod shape-determining protein MreC [Bernardetiaceae bacterium]